jgi:hypothetical protein
VRRIIGTQALDGATRPDATEPVRKSQVDGLATPAAVPDVARVLR